MSARTSLQHGASFPYDGGEKFWDSEDTAAKPPPAKDWAHRAARGILSDLGDRGGIKHELEEVDHGTRKELTRTMADIIRLAYLEDKHGC